MGADHRQCRPEWHHPQPEPLLRKVTTKSGRIVAHDLKLCPLTLSLLTEAEDAV